MPGCYSFNLEGEEKMETNELEKMLEKEIENVEAPLEEELEEKGIVLNDDHSTIKYINWNVFIAYFLTIYTIIYTDLNILYVYSGNVYRVLSDNTLLRIVRNLLQRLVPNSWKWTYEKVVLSTIKLAALKVSSFNQDMKRLNLLNGIWNLEKQKLLKHTPKLYTSNQLPIAYDENARCPKFKKFLKDIFEGDKQRIKLIQEIMGYCLTNLVLAQKAFIFLGVGANGKSVLLDILIKLVGKNNISTLPLSDFESSFRRRMLVDKKLNVVTEGEFKSNAFSTNQFKAIVSGDLTTAEVKGGELFNFQPFCKVVVAMNALPRVKDQSYGFKRRICVVVFDKVIKKEDQNKNLQAEIVNELDGIFNFALNGLIRLQKNDFNFTESKKCKEFMKEYFDYNSPLDNFVDETIVQGTEKQRISYADLFNKYIDWSSEQGISIKDYERRQFAMDIKNILKLKEIAFEKDKRNGIRGLKGIWWK